MLIYEKRSELAHKRHGSVPPAADVTPCRLHGHQATCDKHIIRRGSLNVEPGVHGRPGFPPATLMVADSLVATPDVAVPDDRHVVEESLRHYFF